MSESNSIWGYLASRITSDHFSAVREAADKEGVTPAEYVRSLVVPWAYADLGKDPPDMSIYTTDRTVKEAAAAQGLTVRQYMARAAKAAAVRDLGIPAKRVSEIRKAVTR